MLINWIRTFYSDNGTLSDKSLVSQDETGFTAVMVTGEDYIYIGQSFPFNQIYFQISTANTTTANLSVDYWADTWRSTVDLLDGTSSAGKTLAKSGVIQWFPSDLYPFQIVTKTSDTSNTPTELQTLTIYDMYWIRLKVSATLSAGTAIKKITYMFTNDTVISALDPDINEYLTNWTAGKTNWVDQIVVASNATILDLKGKNLIRSPAQILRFDELYLAVGYKALSIIYNGLGEKFKDKRDFALAQYNAIIGAVGMSVDLNNDAIAQRTEHATGKGQVIR